MNNLFKIAALILIVSVLGCSGAKLKRDKPADVIYKEATSLFDKKYYEDAIAALQELYAKYPMSQYAVKAKLKIADAYFNDENYPEAISAYKEFEKLHPTSESIPYAVFQTGMSHFKQRLTIDRDQTATRNAVVEFQRFLSRFSSNQYAEQVKKNLAICNMDLAENEFYIGHFYFRMGNYIAAAERFKTAMIKYPEFGAMDKVLFFGGRSYIELNEKDKGKALFERLLNDYPSSKYAGETRKILSAQ